MTTNSIKIAVEGPTDKQFLFKYLDFCDIKFDAANIEILGGKSSIKTKQAVYQREIDSGKQVLLLLDYDHQDCEHNQICASYKAKDIITDYYLIGENLKLNKRNNLENLLLSTAKHTKFINCFAQYETCIDKALAEKSKWFAYIEATGNKHDDINYPKIFDLKHANFEPLKNFLNSYLNT